MNLNFLNSGTGVNLDALSMCDFLTPVPPLECKGTPQTAVDGRFPETTAESLQIQPTHQQRNFNGQVLTKLEQIEQELKKHLPYPCHSAYKSKYIYISKHLSLYNTSVAPASQDIPRHPKTFTAATGSTSEERRSR